MLITTKTLAVWSIQANMLGTQQENNVLNVLLASGKTLVITTVDEGEARSIDNALNFYPISGREHNSVDRKERLTLEIIS